jgi:acetate kinase
MKILVINSGSSSLKFTLFDMEGGNNTVIASGLPAPVAAYNYMAVTFSGTVEARKHYRVRIMPTGDLIAYWDTVVIPAPGSGLVIDMTYISAA